jgi:4-hydroxybenzoate polyprenyltransferase
MAHRWWVYQRERFPVLAHGLLIAAFSSSAVCFSALLRGRERYPNAEIFFPPAVPALPSLLVAFVTAFFFFLQLRIADEHKDFDEDARYRPYRPVPRGLVTLRELAVVFALGALVQLGLALWLHPPLLVLLGVTWTYLVLMSKEFFVAHWLRKQHVLYMLSHMAIVPLVDFYATACDWRLHGERPPSGLLWFVAVSYFNGLVIEMGRKIRGPQDEEEGVDTYSHVWGLRKAVLTWLGAMTITAILACCAAWQIGFLLPVVALLLLLLLDAALCGYRLVKGRTNGKSIENRSGIWTLALYLNLGLIPLACRLILPVS